MQESEWLAATEEIRSVFGQRTRSSDSFELVDVLLPVGRYRTLTQPCRRRRRPPILPVPGRRGVSRGAGVCVVRCGLLRRWNRSSRQRAGGAY